MEWNILYELEANETKKHKNYCQFKSPNIVDIILDDGFELNSTLKISYFNLPQRSFYPLDLTKTEISHQLDEKRVETSLDKLETYLMNSNDNNLLSNADNRITICTEKSVLHRLMNWPYVKPQRLEFLACKVGNVVFMAFKKRASDHSSKMNFRYLQLKKFCLTDAPGELPNTAAPLNVNEETYAIYRAELENFDLLYSGEMPGVAAQTEINNLTDLNKCQFVQLKLFPEDKPSIFIGAIRAQARLSNASLIYVASMSTTGQVRSPLKLIDAIKKPEFAGFDERVPFRFLHTILTKITTVISGAKDLSTVYEFKYKAGKFEYRELNENEDGRFLSAKFSEYVNKNWQQ